MTGTGELIIIGADLTDSVLVGEAFIAEAFFRLRAYEMLSWLKMNALTLDQTQDVTVYLLPLEIKLRGASGSLPIFLALLKLYLKKQGLRIRANMAATGIMSLGGRILRVGNALIKVRGALDQGAEIVLVSAGNRRELQEAVVKIRDGEESKESTDEERRQEIIKSGKITDEEMETKVCIVADAVDVLECAIEVEHTSNHEGVTTGKACGPGHATISSM